jgi:hypothetical protein
VPYALNRYRAAPRPAPGRGAPSWSDAHPRPDAPLRTTTAALLAALSAAPLAAQERPAYPGQDRVHVVRPGETLWDIARACTEDPFLWAEIYRLNADQIRDPARIYPEQRLALPECTAAVEQGARPQAVADDARILPTTTVEMPVVRPGDFYRAGVLLPDSEMVELGRLVERVSPTVIPLELTPLINVYDRVYVSLHAPGRLRVGDALHFYRRGREIRPFGRVYVSTGLGVVEALEGNVATVEIRTVYDAISVDDLALPPARFPVRPGATARRPRQGLEARIVGFQVPHALQATEEIAFLDVGRRAGVKEGDEFLAVLPPVKKQWGTRPEIPVGRMRVVRTTENTASARIIELEHPALEPGIPVRLVAKMP